MATITTSQFFDDNVRTAGEAWTLNGGPVLTVRTDTRVHANAPASLTGTLGATTINEGEILYDGRSVRWLAFNSGTGNVPVIGTSITQTGVTGYLLGVYANIQAAPTAPAAAMPASGFIKLREVTGGSYAAGSLGGIGASATGPDVLGWLEIVADQSTDHTLASAFAKTTVRGGRFFLANTNGSVGQQILVPTNGSTTTYPHGMFIETSENSGEYEFWPSINGAAGGWAYNHAAGPRGETDKRQRCCKVISTGALQLGENVDVSGTYAATAQINGTAYASWQTANVPYWTEGTDCFFYAELGFSGIATGDTLHFNFTAGNATIHTGYYVITVINAVLIKVTLPTSLDTRGAATIRFGINITATAHGLFAGDVFNVVIGTGSGFTAGTYTIRYTSANQIYALFQHSGTITTGTCTIHWGTTITTGAAHNLLVGNKVKCDFTTGTGVDGSFFIYSVPTTTTLVINVPFNGGTGGNVTMQFTIGHVPPNNCRVWIPNVIFRQCATGTRETNALPHATIGTRPEFVTTATGVIDFDYAYMDWNVNLVHVTMVTLKNSVFCDRIVVSEVADPIDIDTVGIGGMSSLGVAPLSASYLINGGSVKKLTTGKDCLSTANTYGIDFSYSYNLSITNYENFQYGNNRSSSNHTLFASVCGNISTDGVKSVGASTTFYGTGNAITIKNTDYCSQISGATGVQLGAVATVNSNSFDVTIDGVTVGFNGTIPYCAPFTEWVTDRGARTKVRNIGSFASPLAGAGYRLGQTSSGRLLSISYDAAGGKYQRLYVGSVLSPITSTNANANVLFSEVMHTHPLLATGQPMQMSVHPYNTVMRGCRLSGVLYGVGQTAVFGTHFVDYFTSDTTGVVELLMNKSTAATADQVTVADGPGFSNAGTIWMRVIGNETTWEDKTYRKGHTAFQNNIAPLFLGATGQAYTVEYKIDKGSGFNAEWRNLCTGRLLTTVSGNSTINDVDTADIAIGDYLIYGGSTTNVLAPATRVIGKEGSILTLDKAAQASTTNLLVFATNLPNETGIDPEIGFKLRIRVKTVTSNSNSLVLLRIYTRSTALAQASIYWPLDTNTVTFTGLPTGCDLVVLSAGTTTILNQQDAVASTSISYTYSGAHNVDVGFIRPGYIPFYIRNLALTTTDTNIPVALTPDRNYA